MSRLLFSRSVSVQLFETPWTVVHQASLSFTVSQSLLKLMSIESVIPSNHLILCHPLLLLPSPFPSFRVFSNELALSIRWAKYVSFSFSINLSNEYSGLITFSIEWFDLLESKGLSRVFSSTTVRKHQFFSAQVQDLACEQHSPRMWNPNLQHWTALLWVCYNALHSFQFHILGNEARALD